jgi:hypothetical protein
MEFHDPNRAHAETIARPMTAVLTVLAGLARIGTHLAPQFTNFNLIGGLGIFGGARLRSWQAYALPFAILVATNAFLGFWLGKEYFFDSTVFISYVSFLGYVLIGRYLINTESPLQIGAGSLLGSVQFFLVTNFAHWLFWAVDASHVGPLEPGQYPRTLAGLIACFAAGMEFFPRTLSGDLFCTGTLFGVHALLTRAYFPLERAGGQPQARPIAQTAELISSAGR